MCVGDVGVGVVLFDFVLLSCKVYSFDDVIVLFVLFVGL